MFPRVTVELRIGDHVIAEVGVEESSSFHGTGSHSFSAAGDLEHPEPLSATEMEARRVRGLAQRLIDACHDNVASSMRGDG